MQINVTVHRSAEWVKAQRVATSDNVPDKIKVPVEVSDLSEETRRRLIEAQPQYGDIVEVAYDSDGTIGGINGSYGYCRYGCCAITTDSAAPTVAEIDAAIMSAFRAADTECERIREEKAAREARKVAELEAKAARELKLAEARELLADELARGERAAADRATLADFLSEVPEDALRGTLKRLAHSAEAIEALRDKVESASPRVTIFSADDDDE